MLAWMRVNDESVAPIPDPRSLIPEYGVIL